MLPVYDGSPVLWISGSLLLTKTVPSGRPHFFRREKGRKMDNTKLISIIVPIYKVEKYLEECIQSMISQTYKNLEIILVDDGSPDNCGKICDEYARQDSRIKVIHKENAGVARARNSGLDIARGDFISFIDSDDYVAEDAYEKLFKVMLASHADCVVGGCVKIYEDENGNIVKRDQVVVSPDQEKDYVVKSAEEAMQDVLLRGSAAWNRLYKKEIFETLRFPVDRVNDDEVTALHAYALCKQIVFTRIPTYFYRLRANSITTSNFSLRNVDVFYNSRDNLEFVSGGHPALIPAGEFKYIKSALYCYWNLRKMKRSEEEEKAFQKLGEEIRSGDFASKVKKNPYLAFPYKALYRMIAWKIL